MEVSKWSSGYRRRATSAREPDFYCQLSLYKFTLCSTRSLTSFDFAHVPSCWFDGFVFFQGEPTPSQDKKVNYMLRKLDGRVVIVGAQRVLESQILKCQLSLYKLTLCGTRFFIFFTFVHVLSCWLNGFVFIFRLTMRTSLFFQTETKR